MPLTRIQPSGIDTTKNYSVNQISANTVVAGGVDLYVFANSAFAKANTGVAANTFVQVGFPLGDRGLLTDQASSGLGGEQYLTIWDNRVTLPTSTYFANNLIQLDAGYLS